MRVNLTFALSAMAVLGHSSSVLGSSIEDVRSAVAEVRASLDDLAVDIRVDKIAADSAALEGQDISFAWKPGMLRIEQEMEFPGQSTDHSFLVAVSTDGDSNWQYNALSRSAARLVGSNSNFELGGNWWLESMGFFPHSDAVDDPATARDLLVILESGDVSLQEEMELVDGIECYVVSHYRDGDLVQKLWLDPGRSFMPRKQQYFGGESGGAIIDILVSSFAERDGIWFPVDVMRVVHASPEVEGLAQATIYSVQVPRDVVTGDFRIEVNSGLLDSYFDYSTELPPGVVVLDEASGQQWIAGGIDFRSSAESALASLTLPESSIPARLVAASESTSAVQRRAPWTNPRWFGLGLIAAASGLLVWAPWRRS